MWSGAFENFSRRRIVREIRTFGASARRNVTWTRSDDVVIGVMCKADQTAAVEEFFQLFKTPWEFYQPARAYDDGTFPLLPLRDPKE